MADDFCLMEMDVQRESLRENISEGLFPLIYNLFLDWSDPNHTLCKQIVLLEALLVL